MHFFVSYIEYAEHVFYKFLYVFHQSVMLSRNNILTD